MFAVIKTGGLQYRVAPQDVLTIGRVPGEPGEIVQFSDVLMLGGDAITVGSPAVAGASVAAEVVQQTRAPTVIAFKKRRRKNSRRKRGHRQELTVIRVTEILTDGRQPSRSSPADASAPVSGEGEAAPAAV
jgi:large subunit ribosomal protein L21